MTVLPTFLLAVAAQAPAVATPSPTPPNRLVLDQFKMVCELVADYGRMRDAALASGWVPVQEGAAPQLDRINQVSRQAIGDEGRLQDQSFGRASSGQPTLYLVISRWEGSEGKWGNGCRVYDLDASAPIAPALLTAWMGRPPTGTQTFGPAGSNLLWEPGWRDGLSVSVNHVPATSPFRERYGLSGNVLVAQALGGN